MTKAYPIVQKGYMRTSSSGPDAGPCPAIRGREMVSGAAGVEHVGGPAVRSDSTTVRSRARKGASR